MIDQRRSQRDGGSSGIEVKGEGLERIRKSFFWFKERKAKGGLKKKNKFLRETDLRHGTDRRRTSAHGNRTQK